MTVRSPYVQWYVNQAIRDFCHCEVTTVELPHPNEYGVTEYSHTLHNEHFDKHGWPTELIYQLVQTFPEFRLRFV